MRGVSTRCFGPIRFAGSGSRLACSGILFAIALTCVGQDGKPPQDAVTPQAQSPDVNPHSGKDKKGQKSGTGDSDRKKQIADESAQLLNMALALKAEVDKTTKDTLSLNVIKKADQIEKLAKSVKEKMKQSSGS